MRAEQEARARAERKAARLRAEEEARERAVGAAERAKLRAKHRQAIAHHNQGRGWGMYSKWRTA